MGEPPRILTTDAPADAPTDAPTDSRGYRAARRPLTDHGTEVTR
ncbi:hypothetical protein ACFT9I_27260 [Streptomyces sp. NPDC057137]